MALLVNLAAPPVANARTAASRHRHALGEICTASGLKTIIVSGADRAPGDHGDLLHDGHCKLCSIAAAVGLPPADPALLPVEVGFADNAPPRARAVAVRLYYPRPQSHAPPFLS